MPLQPLRIIDANLNRSSEGLRFLEDIARFLFNDAVLCQQLRVIRHNLAEVAKSLSVKLLSQRNSEHDVGANVDVVVSKAKQSPQNLLGLITANAKRVEESLRVMEELAKLSEISSVLNSAKFEQARFTLYTLERELISKTLRQDKIKRLSGLYVILDRQVLAGRDELDIASEVIREGVKIIQLRDKQNGNKGELLYIAQKLKNLCVESNVLLIINDYLDLVLAVNADGLHIGQGDLPLPIIRKELPVDKIVGCSVTTVSQAIKAQNEGADYIAIGSIFPTATKRGASVVGIDRLKEVKEAIVTPIVAIGGINEDNIGQVMAAGADSVAVISAVLNKEDVKGSVQQLVTKMGMG